MITKSNTENSPNNVNVTPEMYEAGLMAMVPYTLTTDGYDLEKALPAAFKAMIEKYEESRFRDQKNSK